MSISSALCFNSDIFIFVQTKNSTRMWGKRKTNWYLLIFLTICKYLFWVNKPSQLSVYCSALPCCVQYTRTAYTECIQFTLYCRFMSSKCWLCAIAIRHTHSLHSSRRIHRMIWAEEESMRPHVWETRWAQASSVPVQMHVTFYIFRAPASTHWSRSRICFCCLHAIKIDQSAYFAAAFCQPTVHNREKNETYWWPHQCKSYELFSRSLSLSRE